MQIHRYRYTKPDGGGQGGGWGIWEGRQLGGEGSNLANDPPYVFGTALLNVMGYSVSESPS